MFSLFNAKEGPLTRKDLPTGPERYTRFATAHPQKRIPPAPAPAPEPVAAADVPREAKPVGAHRPITRAALVKPQKIDENAHLHADSRISVAVLRKALPQRFAKMDEDTPVTGFERAHG